MKSLSPAGVVEAPSYATTVRKLPKSGCTLHGWTGCISIRVQTTSTGYKLAPTMSLSRRASASRPHTLCRWQILIHLVLERALPLVTTRGRRQLLVELVVVRELSLISPTDDYYVGATWRHVDAVLGVATCRSSFVSS